MRLDLIRVICGPTTRSLFNVARDTYNVDGPFRTAVKRASSRLSHVMCTCAIVALPVGLCAIRVAAQANRTTVGSTTLRPTSARQWHTELAYREGQIFPMTTDASGCPVIPVDIGGVTIGLMFDTGTAHGFVLTTSAPAVPHTVEHRDEELNADGTHRGESLTIRVQTLSVLGRSFEKVTGTIADWRMFASKPFNGTVGLDFFADRRVTLDYRSRQVAVSVAPIPVRLDPERYVIVDLVNAPTSQGHALYVRAKVNGRPAIVYMDTGYNVSFIDPAFADGLPRSERPGKFPLFRQQVPVELGGHVFSLDDVREAPISRGPGFEPPVALTLGSDVLSRFVVTIDLRAMKLVLASAA